MKRIQWLLPANFENKQDILSANIASIRLRAGIFLHPLFKNFNINFGNKNIQTEKLDYLFVGKFAGKNDHDETTWLEIISKCKNVFIDITDDHFNNATKMSNFYNNALKYKPKIITSSNLLQNKMKLKEIKNVFVIEDPIEIQIQKPIKQNNQTYLWFGHETNLNFLYKMLLKWPSKIPWTLFILTSIRGINFLKNDLPQLKINARVSIKILPWTIENMIGASKECSSVLIPGDINNERKNGVSHNRLITSFALGLPVAATLYDSYLEFKDYFCNIDDADLFNNFIEDNKDYQNKTGEAQVKIKKYTFDEIPKKWLQIIE
jgi:hypothetical protein